MKIAEALGKEIARDGLKRTQVYKIFGELRKIEMRERTRINEKKLEQSSKRNLILLKPRLSWQAERIKEFKRLKEVFETCIDEVGDDRERFFNFVDFAEAILAYHRAAGG